MNPLLNITDMKKHYPSFALEGVSLAVEPGMVVGLVGQNGAGKTTTLKAILGLIGIDGGTIELFGQRITVGSATLDNLKQDIGVVLDSCSFPASLKVKDVEKLGRVAYRRWDAPYWSELCQRFGLGANKKVQELSRGMGMKLSLAFALAHHPRLLVLDEATAGLDPMARDEALDCLRAFMEDDACGILMSTHITTDLEKVADEVVCMDAGRIIFSLAKDAITDEAGIAHLRAADLEAVAAAKLPEKGRMRTMARGYSTDLLVPDRLAFAHAFPAIAVDRATIEDYMAFTLKGAAL